MTRCSIFGFGGDPLVAPDHSEVSLWAALAAGADGIVVSVQRTKDDVLVCARQNNLQPLTDEPDFVNELSWQQAEDMDIGAGFRSKLLDENGLPISEQGAQNVWHRKHDRRRRIRLLRFDEMLAKFARRIRVLIFLPPHDEKLCDLTLAVLRQFGLGRRVLMIGDQESCHHLAAQMPDVRLALNGMQQANASNSLQTAQELSLDALLVDWDTFTQDDASSLVDALNNSGLDILLANNSGAFFPASVATHLFTQLSRLSGIITKGVIPSVEKFTPPALVITEPFTGTKFDRNKWSAGYSHINGETRIYQDDGLHIDIQQGASYSGAAAINNLPVHGRFDAQVDFQVSNPDVGTTFEMAAICVDPGYHQMDNSKLNSRSVNLSFDVHGAPPYASSECAEANGFRCGWNNAANFTRIDTDWNASSGNMYNKYGRKVGNGAGENHRGSLRLVRNGSVFSTYFKDEENPVWVCSGAMLVQRMAEDVYIRLAAKHWAKNGVVPPANHIIFSNFKVFQF